MSGSVVRPVCRVRRLAGHNSRFATTARAATLALMPEVSDKSLESWIWDAACSIRGAKDAPKF
ncbi:MAG: hypothetical protein AAB676_11545, partial [Verrucomicrobiota bacterium]